MNRNENPIVKLANDFQENCENHQFQLRSFLTTNGIPRVWPKKFASCYCPKIVNSMIGQRKKEKEEKPSVSEASVFISVLRR